MESTEVRSSDCVNLARRVRPGQPVLFWISGTSKAHPAGIYAQGQTTSRATAEVADDEWVDPAERGRPKLFMSVSLRPSQRRCFLVTSSSIIALTYGGAQDGRGQQPVLRYARRVGSTALTWLQLAVK